MNEVDSENERELRTKITRGNWMCIYQTAISIDTGLTTDLIPEKIMLID